MDLQNIFLLVVALINIFLGFAIYFHGGRRDKLNVTFSLVALAVALWTLAMVIFRLDIGYNLSLTALAFLYAIPVFIPVFFLYFVYLFTQTKAVFFNEKIVIFLSSIITLFVAVSVFSGMIVSGVIIPEEGEKIVQFGGWYGIYVLHFLLFFGAAFTLLARRFFLATDPLFKRQIKHLFFGTFIASTLGMFTNLFLPWFGFFELNWFGNLATIVFAGFIFYAVSRYRLLNVGVIAAEIFVVFILTLLIIELFFTASAVELAVKGFVLISVSLFGYLLIRGAYREEKARKEIERLAKELRVANKQLKELDQRKSEFLSLASHQLRTPLTAMKGYSSMLVEGTFGKLPKKAKEVSQRIFDSSQRLVAIIEDFLTISRIEQNRLKYEFQTIDLKKVIEVVKGEFAQSAKAKKLTLGFHSDKKELYHVVADLGKVTQAIGNLLDNAIKYTQKGGITMTLQKDPARHVVLLSVSDTGVGMSEETIERLFQKFSRADEAYRVNTKGVGLGLYVASRIVKEHRGKLWAESGGEGKGSVFYVELPSEE